MDSVKANSTQRGSGVPAVEIRLRPLHAVTLIDSRRTTGVVVILEVQAGKHTSRN